MSRPKHLEIREWIEMRISDGTYEEGDRLPTEKQLMEKFRVSRNPVQRAMEGLVEAGLIRRRRGSGTTVSSRPMYTDLLRHIDASPTSPIGDGPRTVLSVNVSSSESFALSDKSMPAGTPAVEITRVLLSGQSKAIAVERTVVDLTFAPNILSADLEDLTTTAYFSAEGREIHSVTSEFHAVHLSPAQAATMELTTSTPAIKQLRRIFAPDHRCIEVTELVFHPHRLTFEVACYLREGRGSARARAAVSAVTADG